MPSLGFETHLPHDVALSDSRGCVFDAARLAATVESCARSTLEVLDFISVVVTSVVLSRIGMRFASECDSFEAATGPRRLASCIVLGVTRFHGGGRDCCLDRLGRLLCDVLLLYATVVAPRGVEGPAPCLNRPRGRSRAILRCGFVPLTKSPKLSVRTAAPRGGASCSFRLVTFAAVRVVHLF